MMTATRLRAVKSVARQLAIPRRTFAVTSRQCEAGNTGNYAGENQSKAPAVTTDGKPQVTPVGSDKGTEILQAPNRAEIWSRSQRPRAEAMTGPRFEQTDFDLQPQPYAAIELVHKVPVKWTHDRMVVCDGGGGPHGHPKIFINTDKPEIAVCGYCGNPFANEHNRKHLESLPQTSYPL
ncbi:hypothetical protein DL546_005373 [Coniochaeta pulveracea]|uniref:Zinc finger CHCC-type domain-containing protein n=1 Tax=Coniochaeta pulveracea TaxID=177199 RepID=A0A420Y8K2_9PEZI|nr:hypothetical protein DL546_005373 [Coniochaeta pulveracea]